MPLRLCLIDVGERQQQPGQRLGAHVTSKCSKRLATLQRSDLAELVAIDPDPPPCISIRQVQPGRSVTFRHPHPPTGRAESGIDGLGRRMHQCIAQTVQIGCRCGDWLADDHAQAMAQPLNGPLIEKPFAFERENRAPRTVAPERHQGMAGLLGDECEAALQFAQRASTRQLPLGKQTHRVALFQGRYDTADRLPWLLLVDTERVEKPDKPRHRRLLHIGVFHHKAHWPTTGSGDEKRIGIGHVIGQQQHPTVSRQIFIMKRANLIDHMHQGSGQQAQEMSRHQADDHPSHQQAKRAGDGDLHAQSLQGIQAAALGEPAEGFDESGG